MRFFLYPTLDCYLTSRHQVLSMKYCLGGEIIFGERQLFGVTLR
jgi:hypothetical protein